MVRVSSRTSIIRCFSYSKSTFWYSGRIYVALSGVLYPIHTSLPITVIPSKQDFSGGDLDADHIYPSTLKYIEDFPATILCYKVHYDKSKDLCYTDIELSQISYFPFVSFALVRLQANSVKGAHASSIVLSDFAQILPPRTLTVTRYFL